jgi:hypothetical protein
MAKRHYERGLSFSDHLNDDEYSNMVKLGLEGGLKRVASEMEV